MIYDISMLINANMQVYKNIVEKKPKFELVLNFSENSCNESKVDMNLHTGTHIDAPFHMIDGGKTVEDIAIKELIRDCKVIDLTEVEDRITEKDLKKKDIEKGDFVLLKTKNSYENEFNYKFIYLEKSGAEYLKDAMVAGVGIDALGIERDQKNHDTHMILFTNNIIIIEGLRLKEVCMGKYSMYALPIKLENVDGAPARVILIDDK